MRKVFRCNDLWLKSNQFILLFRWFIVFGFSFCLFVVKKKCLARFIIYLHSFNDDILFNKKKEKPFKGMFDFYYWSCHHHTMLFMISDFIYNNEIKEKISFNSFFFFFFLLVRALKGKDMIQIS